MEPELLETLARRQRDAWTKKTALDNAQAVAKEILEFLGGRYHRRTLPRRR